MDWIKIKKVKPDYGVRVLVWNENEPYEPSRVDELVSETTTKKGTHLTWAFGSSPTHWMPLPEPPKD